MPQKRQLQTGMAGANSAGSGFAASRREEPDLMGPGWTLLAALEVGHCMRPKG